LDAARSDAVAIEKDPPVAESAAAFATDARWPPAGGGGET
jgi:hypothetical protein